MTKELKNSKEFVGAIAEEIFGKMGGKVPNLASNTDTQNSPNYGFIRTFFERTHSPWGIKAKEKPV